MNSNNHISLTKSFFRHTDWKLLIFLILLLDVKILVKLFAIVLIYILQGDFKFGFKIKNSRLPLFYLAMPVIAGINWVFNRGFLNLSASVAFGTGIIFWLLCLLSIHQLKLFTEKNDRVIIHNTLILFFAINILVSFINYFSIIIETGALNPFHYRGMADKYYMSTGDYIKGISFDTSITNSVLSAMGVIYFLMNRNGIMMSLCMLVLLLTGSNATNILLCFVLIYILLFQSTKHQKWLTGICFLLLAFFLTFISAENAKYIRRFTGGISPAADMLTKDTTRHGMPGKVRSYMQTFQFLKEHPERIVTGDGMGNFSSSLAFRTTAMGLAGSYPVKFKYINKDFEENHLAIYLSYFTGATYLHSVTNSPHSVYNQIAGEYGLAGILSFLLLYLGYFYSRRTRPMPLLIPLILFTMAILSIDYWFEQLSILIIFELLLLTGTQDTSSTIIKNKNA